MAASPSDVATATFIELGAPAMPVRQPVKPLVESVTRTKVNGQQAHTYKHIYILIQRYILSMPLFRTFTFMRTLHFFA